MVAAPGLEEISPGTLEKVTAFIVRSAGDGQELLLFQHPYAGIQIPAGTVEKGEAPDVAVLRETFEETGLRDVTIAEYLGAQEDPPFPEHLLISERTTVYARPDRASFDWAMLPRAAMVRLEQELGDWSQVTYVEWDRWPNPHYVTYQITGWVVNSALTASQTRHFYKLECHEKTAVQWEVETDYHRFGLFWVPLTDLPEITPPQAGWLGVLCGDGRTTQRPDR